jgi:predicted phosphodiesterase
MSNTIKATIAKQVLDKFPSIPLLTAAKKIYKENPTVFKNVEDARSAVRYQAGQTGRDYSVRDKTHVREKTYNYNPFNLPESHADSFEPFSVKDSRVIVLSDPHFPYQDNNAINVALKYALEKNPNCIILNGDIIDFAPISRHEKDWRQRSVAQEFDAVRQFLSSLRKTFPKARIIYKMGNHDERWEKWLTVKAPELLDCSDFELEVLLRFGEHKIEIVKDKRVIMVGKLPLLHGHELYGGGGVNPGRSTFLKTYSNVLISHVHKRSISENVNLLGENLTASSMGCLCGLHPKYMPINQWSHGFCYVTQDKEGNYDLQNLKIINNKVC